MIDYKYEYQLRCILNKVNRVTSAHRHGQCISKKDLDALSNRQIDVEAALPHRTPKTNGSETITITITKKQLLDGVQKTVYARCRLPSQAMHGITTRLWEYLSKLSTEA